MEKKEVKSKLEAVNKLIKEIENSDEVLLYVTKDKHLPGVGYISEIDSFSDLIKAHKEITKLSENDLSESAKALGLTESEIPENDVKILGFKPSYWFKDIETRLKEFRNEIKLQKLHAAKISLEKHLSEDDIFQMDTVGIDELLA